jgi:hypothetical protein
MRPLSQYMERQGLIWAADIDHAGKVLLLALYWQLDGYEEGSADVVQLAQMTRYANGTVIQALYQLRAVQAIVSRNIPRKSAAIINATKPHVMTAFDYCIDWEVIKKLRLKEGSEL